MKLTLAIPTCNRASYLELLLASIAKQVPPFLDHVEILVSDNASPDQTPLVVEKYARLVPITYIRQEENLGSDLNFVRLYAAARGRYFWMIGDDDILLPNALRAVLDTIDAINPAHIYVMPKGFRDYIDPASHANRKVKVLTLNRQTFLERVNIFLTFISSNVVNKAALADRVSVSELEVFASERSCFTQYGWVLPSVMGQGALAYIPNYLVAAQSGNAEGYATFRVFIESHNKALKRFLASYPEATRAIQNRSLMRFFPNRVVRGKMGVQQLDEPLADVESMFRSHFSGNPWYWLMVWPLLRTSPPLRHLARLWQWGLLFLLETQLWIRMKLGGRRVQLDYSDTAA